MTTNGQRQYYAQGPAVAGNSRCELEVWPIIQLRASAHRLNFFLKFPASAEARRPRDMVRFYGEDPSEDFRDPRQGYSSDSSDDSCVDDPDGVQVVDNVQVLEHVQVIEHVQDAGAEDVQVVEGNSLDLDWNKVVAVDCDVGLPSIPEKTVNYTLKTMSDGRRRLAAEAAEAADKQGHPCHVCGKVLCSAANLSRHQQTHRGLSVAEHCAVCGKAYVSPSALAMHALTHRMAFACGVCGKLFSRRWLLKVHLRTHSGERPYGCGYCGKPFMDRSNLRVHMRQHGEAATEAASGAVCPHCAKSFAAKSYLSKHLQSCGAAAGQCST